MVYAILLHQPLSLQQLCSATSHNPKSISMPPVSIETEHSMLALQARTESGIGLGFYCIEIYLQSMSSRMMVKREKLHA